MKPEVCRLENNKLIEQLKVLVMVISKINVSLFARFFVNDIILFFSLRLFLLKRMLVTVMSRELLTLVLTPPFVAHFVMFFE